MYVKPEYTVAITKQKSNYEGNGLVIKTKLQKGEKIFELQRNNRAGAVQLFKNR